MEYLVNTIARALDVLVSGIGFSFPDTLLFLNIALSLLLGTQDYRIGLIFMFIGNIILYILYTFFSIETTRVTIMVFISLVLLAFSLFLSKNDGRVLN